MAPKAANKKKGLVILVNFKDLAFKSTSTRQVFDQMCNGVEAPVGKNYGSVHEYFLAQSYGQFDLEFDVVGPYTVSYNYGYYGKDIGNEGDDAHPEEMIEEACKLADADVNFADYDWDNDGEVEQVYVIYAGYGQSSGASANTIWPHEWDLSSAFQYNNKRYNYSLKLDGRYINTYACSSELYGKSGNTIDGVGTMCHEFSHCMGLPDFYATGSQNYFGMDSWDLMDYGCYNGNGYSPAGYTAYERWFCGWLEPTLLADPSTVRDMPAIQDEPQAYVILSSGVSANVNGSYYLLYNHQQKGWDEKSYGHGMLVQYVRYSAEAWEDNTVNNTSTQRMTLVPGDGDFNSSTPAGLAGDPWPGTSGNSFFEWNNHTVEEIEEKTGLISFLFDGGESVFEVPVVDEAAVVAGPNFFTAVWQPVEEAVAYNLRYREVVIPQESILLSENFEKLTDDKDGTSDVSSKLNEYMADAGWTGEKIFVGTNGAKFGSSTSAGSLTTPQLTTKTGTVTVLFHTREWVSSSGTLDKYSFQIAVNDADGEELYEQLFTQQTDEDVVVTFTDVPADFTVTFSTTAAKRRAYLSKVAIYDGEFSLKEIQNSSGNQNESAAWALVKDIRKAQYTVYNLEKEKSYEYQLQSVRNDGVTSRWSDRYRVALNNPNSVSLFPGQAMRAPSSQVYDLSGRPVNGKPQKRGIYVADGKKVIVP